MVFLKAKYGLYQNASAGKLPIVLFGSEVVHPLKLDRV